eukprot:SAG22_NODE_214_length_15003_cov_18.466519_3_plen_32_part_00
MEQLEAMGLHDGVEAAGIASEPAAHEAWAYF